MAKSRLLDRGREEVTLYPEVIVTNKRGTRIATPSETGVTVPCTVSAEDQSVAELPGQVQVKVVRVLIRSLPEGELSAYSRADFRGETWSLSTPPHWSSGASRATEHWEITLSSRNKLGGQ